MEFLEKLKSLFMQFINFLSKSSIFRFLTLWQFWVSIALAVVILFILLQLSFSYFKKYTKHGVEISVPMITNLTIDDALIKLSEVKLNYEIDTSSFSKEFKPYQVLSVYPLTGSTVKEGRKIFIKANARTWKKVSVPDIVKKSKYLAFKQLELVGLTVGDTIFKPSLAENVILDMTYNGESIEPGTLLPRFTSISLVIGKRLSKKSVDNLIGLNENEAIRIIKENLFGIGNVTYEAGTKANARVFYQVPLPNTTYDQGLLIDIWLSDKPREELSEEIKNLDLIYNRQVNNNNNSLNPNYNENNSNSNGGDINSNINTKQPQSGNNPDINFDE